jgi:glycosyltransferase involved in cell wall biosynthesis
MHIGITGPIATHDVEPLLDTPASQLPPGCDGAPLLATLIAELLRRGHRVSAFTLSNGMPLRDGESTVARGPGFELHLSPNRPLAWPPNGWRPGRIVDLYAFERRGLQRAIARAQPDLVHAHWSYEFAWAALRSGLPHVITCHDSPFVVAGYQRDLRHGAFRWLRAGMAWHVLRRARCVTTVSPYMVGQVQRLCRVPVGLVPNPIAAQALALRRTERPGRIQVIMVCNGWGALKNCATALDAFARLSRRLPTARLQLYGHDCGVGGAAQRWLRQEGLGGDVVFNGTVSHAEVLHAMSSSDLLLHPSLEESFGAVLAEAMAVGLPVLAGARSGAVPWVVGDGGALVDVRNPDAMADAMHTLLTNPALLETLGRRGRERVLACFTPAAVAALYEREYAAVVERTAAVEGVPA